MPPVASRFAIFCAGSAGSANRRRLSAAAEQQSDCGRVDGRANDDEQQQQAFVAERRKLRGVVPAKTRRGPQRGGEDTARD